MFRPAPPQRLTIPGPEGALEALVDEPATAVTRFAVVCHPHPQFGGTMDNKVVHTLARALLELGFAAVRFNFRGVGASAGSFDDGRGETADALAVIDWAQARWGGAPFWLAGFSFGAYVAIRVATERVPEQLITVAPPVQRFQMGNLPTPACPWLLIQGDADEVVEPNGVLEWARQLVPPPQITVLKGVGHYFHGRLQDLKTAVRTIVAQRVGLPQD